MLEIYVGIAFLCWKHRHTFWFLCWKYRHTYISSKKSLKIAPFLMPEKVLRVSFARYAFCGHKPLSCILLGESPKTPDICIGVSLFDALFGTPFLKTVFSTLEGVSLFDTLFGKVLHFLTHLLKNGSTF